MTEMGGQYHRNIQLADRFSSEGTYVYAGNNPVMNIDIGGNYKFPAELVKKYPNFARYLKENVRHDVMNSKVILEAFARHTAADSPTGTGNLTPKEVEKAVTWGSGPEIIIVDSPGGRLSAHGFFDHTANQIHLKKSDIDALEAALSGDGPTSEKLQSLLPTYMTLLHETVHYGDYLDGLRQDGGEPGVDFEIDVWGKKGKEADGTQFTVARFFPDKYKDKKSLVNAINEYLNSNRSDLLPTVPKNK
jgi:hypothetical protein